MLPILTALALALSIGAVTYGALSLASRRTRLSPVPDDAPPPSRIGAVIAALVGLVAVGACIGAIAEAIQTESVVVRWDDKVELWAAQHAGPLGTDALRLLTHLGDTVTVIGIMVVTVSLLLWAGHRRLALFMATVVIGQWAISNLIKEAVARARPALDPLASFHGFSFPSGHSTAAAGTYLALAIVLTAIRPTWSRRLLLASAVSIAVAVAASRALLGVHWFSDVVGGLMLGWTWCLICAVLYDVLNRAPAPSSSPSAGGDVLVD